MLVFFLLNNLNVCGGSLYGFVSLVKWYLNIKWCGLVVVGLGVVGSYCVGIVYYCVDCMCFVLLLLIY